MKKLLLYFALLCVCTMLQAQVAYTYNYATGNVMTHAVYDIQRPHAVAQVDNICQKIPSSTQQTSYNAHGKIACIEEGDNVLTLFYGPDDRRWQTTLTKGGEISKTILFLGDYEVVDSGGIQRKYWYVADGVILYRESASGSIATGQPTPLYALQDNLGSYLKLYTESGEEVFSAQYDAWGQHQTAITHQPSPITSFTFHRGYTVHEMLPEFGIINMNGRLYDPLIARFLSPDNYIQQPDNTQNFNRYSYCLNNPLKYTDPSGEVFWLIPALVGGVVNLVSNVFSGHVHSLGQGFTHFLTGAGAGVMSALGMPITAVGLLGAANSVTNQGFENGWGNINYDAALFDGIVSAVSACGTQYVANALSKPISSITSGISNPIVRNVATQAAINATISSGMNMGMTALNGDFRNVWKSGWQGLWQGAATGAITGAGQGVADMKFQNKIRNMSPHEKGEYGKALAAAEFRKEGGIILGEEISLDVGGITYRADLIGYKDGQIYVIETKFGSSAGLTKNQRIIFPLLETGSSFMPFGAKASKIPQLQVSMQTKTPITSYTFQIRRYNY